MTREILEGLRRLLDQPSGGALATITRTSGSTYQREGAKMLCLDDRTRIGSVSGGCLEADVAAAASAVVDRGIPALIKYDTNAANDNVWGLGLGCNGTVDVLVESLDWWRTDAGRRIFVAITTCLDAGRRGVLATVLIADGRWPGRIERAFIDSNGEITGSLGRAAVDHFAQEEALRMLREDSLESAGRGTRATQNTDEGGNLDATSDSPAPESGGIPARPYAEGVFSLFLDVLVPPARLLIIGSGQDTVPLAQMARTLGMIVTVIDNHPEAALRERAPHADTVVSVETAHLGGAVSFAGRPALILMTHNYAKDRDALAHVLTAEDDFAYIGVLGPRSRTQQILDDLSASGVMLRPGHVAALRTPIGLDLGARSPAEIALAVLAEVLAVTNRRSAQPLRDKRTSVGQAA